MPPSTHKYMYMYHIYTYMYSVVLWFLWSMRDQKIVKCTLKNGRKIFLLHVHVYVHDMYMYKYEGVESRTGSAPVSRVC